MVLNAADDSAETIQTWLLLALREIFIAGIDFLSTDEILEILNGEEEAPWADWEKKMTAKKLAALLRPFNVKPKQKRHGGDPLRGYYKEDLQPAFDRYLSPSPLPPSPGPAQPVTSPGDRVPEPIGSVTSSKNQPVTSQVVEIKPLHAEAAPGLDPQGLVTSSQVEKEVDCEGDGVDTLNGVKLAPDEAKKVKFAAQIFGGEIVRPDDREPASTPAESKSSPPSETPKAHSPRPGSSDVENRLLTVLAFHDFEGGLAYGEFRRLARLSEDAFDATLKRLCRRGGPVYRSALNGRYQLSPRFAAILARHKNQLTPSKNDL